MKHPLLICVMLASLTLPLQAQAHQTFSIDFTTYEIPAYQLDPLTEQVVLDLPYADSLIKNPEALLAVSDSLIPYEIDFVFTRYPKDLSRWRTDYDLLFQARLRALFGLDSSLQAPAIRWNLYLQTDCRSEFHAKRFFHGFVIKYRPASAEPIEELSSIEELNALLKGKRPSQDSTVLQVLARHPQWRDMLVVVDWTASMYQYGAQVVLWQQAMLNHPDMQASHFVFFNDGDRKKTRQKAIGRTGGIYYTQPKDLEEVLFTMEKVMLKGNGGDEEENDLEVLIKATHLLEGYGDVVLIADNRSDIRDLALLNKLDRPVHVILCGVEADNYINSDYVKLAFHSGGSIHTSFASWENLQDLKPGERIAIGNMDYALKSGRISQLARRP
jgi:hypothetical protein